MSTRTIIEINHDYLADLLGHRRENVDLLLRALGQTLTDAKDVAPPGIRILGQRHHSTTLKLTVK